MIAQSTSGEGRGEDAGEAGLCKARLGANEEDHHFTSGWIL